MEDWERDADAGFASFGATSRATVEVTERRFEAAESAGRRAAADAAVRVWRASRRVARRAACRVDFMGKDLLLHECRDFPL